MDSGWIRNKRVVVVGNFDNVERFLCYDLITFYNCKVLAIGLNEEGMQLFKDKLGSFEDSFSMEVFDYTLEGNWKLLKTKLENESGKVDILINANLNMPKYNCFENLHHKDYKENMENNFYPVVYSIRYLLPFLKQSKVPSIITLFGMEGIGSLKLLSHYSSSRSAVKSFIEVLETELTNFYFSFIYVGVLKGNDSKVEYYKHLKYKGVSYGQTSNKIIRSIKKRRRKVVIGNDAKVISFFHKFSKKMSDKMLSKYFKH